jgi:hypothetical protein
VASLLVTAESLVAVDLGEEGHLPSVSSNLVVVSLFFHAPFEQEPRIIPDGPPFSIFPIFLKVFLLRRPRVAKDLNVGITNFHQDDVITRLVSPFNSRQKTLLDDRRNFCAASDN